MAKKKNESEEEVIQPKFPSMILGLDISTACIGVSVVYDDGVNKPEILKITHIVPKISSKIKGIEALILRKEIFERDFLTKIKDLHITECVIESPLIYSTGASKAETVAQLLQFNGLLSEAVYRVLGIIPHYISSYDARMISFPELMSIRKFNKKGIEYPITHIKKALKEQHLVLFGSYPFDCDKKTVMMNLVCDMYPDIQWVLNKKGELKKENYDACDSLICVLAYINTKRYGEIKPSVISSVIEKLNDEHYNITYIMKVWNKEIEKKIVI